MEVCTLQVHFLVVAVVIKFSVKSLYLVLVRTRKIFTEKILFCEIPVEIVLAQINILMLYIESKSVGVG